MSRDVTVKLMLDTDDDTAIAAFEEKLRGWLRTQPAVKTVDVMKPARWHGEVWREARKSYYGSKLRNPYARTELNT